MLNIFGASMHRNSALLDSASMQRSAESPHCHIHLNALKEPHCVGGDMEGRGPRAEGWLGLSMLALQLMRVAAAVAGLVEQCAAVPLLWLSGVHCLLTLTHPSLPGDWPSDLFLGCGGIVALGG